MRVDHHQALDEIVAKTMAKFQIEDTPVTRLHILKELLQGMKERREELSEVWEERVLFEATIIGEIWKTELYVLYPNVMERLDRYKA